MVNKLRFPQFLSKALCAKLRKKTGRFRDFFAYSVVNFAEIFCLSPKETENNFEFRATTLCIFFPLILPLNLSVSIFDDWSAADCPCYSLRKHTLGKLRHCL